MNLAVEFLVGVVGQTLLVLVIIGAVLGLAIGITLVLDSPRALRWNERMSRWISSRGFTQILDAPRDLKRIIYRRHRVIGLAVVGGAVYALDALTFGFDVQALARAFDDLGNRTLLEVLFKTVQVFFLIGNVAALGAGLILCFRPSLLKGIEGWADRTYLTGDSSKVLDEMHFQPDLWASRHPRLVGGLVLAGSAYVLFNLAVLPLI